MEENKTVSILRVIDFDGMGGKEYIYHCGGCKIEITNFTKFCCHCGSKLGEVKVLDTWGLPHNHK